MPSDWCSITLRNGSSLSLSFVCWLLLSESVSFIVVHLKQRDTLMLHGDELNYSFMYNFQRHLDKEWKLHSETGALRFVSWGRTFRKSFTNRDVYFFTVRLKNHNCHLSTSADSSMKKPKLMNCLWRSALPGATSIGHCKSVSLTTIWQQEQERAISDHQWSTCSSQRVQMI